MNCYTQHHKTRNFTHARIILESITVVNQLPFGIHTNNRPAVKGSNLKELQNLFMSVLQPFFPYQTKSFVTCLTNYCNGEGLQSVHPSGKQNHILSLKISRGKFILTMMIIIMSPTPSLTGYGWFFVLEKGIQPPQWEEGRKQEDIPHSHLLSMTSHPI
jgi:hypothetical protein